MRSNEESAWMRSIGEVRRTVAKHLPLYEEVCEGIPGTSLPEDFRDRVMARLDGFVETLPHHPGGRRNAFNGLMPLLAMLAAVHVVLRDARWTSEQIGRLTYQTFTLKFQRMPLLVRGLKRWVMVSPVLPFLTRGANRAMRESGRQDTFFIDYAYERRPSPATRMRCTRCGMIEYMRANDLMEMASYCNAFDYAQADACGIGLVQPSCLGGGDATCQYTITRDGADTRHPDALARILATPLPGEASRTSCVLPAESQNVACIEGDPEVYLRVIAPPRGSRTP